MHAFTLQLTGALMVLSGHKRLGNSTELGWEGMSQHLGSASRPNSALYQQMYSEGQRAQWGSF